MSRFRVVPNHIYGPAVLDLEHGALVDNGPLESIERIAAALNAALEDDMNWAVPAFDALQPIEAERVMRALGKIARKA